MSVRELVAFSLHSTHLEPSEVREMPIDRIGAFAHGTKLGKLLWRWKYAKQELRGPVLSELLVKARGRFQIGKQHKDHAILERACKQALREWYDQECRNCRGAKEIIAQERRIVCPQCEGVGVHNYGDVERIDALGVTKDVYEKVWERRLRDVFGIISGNDAGTALETFLHLERQKA